MIIRCYSEIILLRTFEERFEYLKLDGRVGEDTFGFDRYINQQFYRSEEWRSIRDFVITRDIGCDLGVSDREIHGRMIIHHMNPIKKHDIVNKTKYLLDPEYLITTVDSTHRAIHYGTSDFLRQAPMERKPNDTCPWLK